MQPCTEVQDAGVFTQQGASAVSRVTLNCNNISNSGHTIHTTQAAQIQMTFEENVWTAMPFLDTCKGCTAI